VTAEEKKQKTRDWAALKRHATKKPWIRLKPAGGIMVGGMFAAVIGIIGLIIGMWACSIIVVAGMVCVVAGKRDEDVRVAKWWYDRVINGPSEQLQARAARSISIHSVVGFPTLFVGGLVCCNVAFQWGLSFPDWTLLIWLVPTAVAGAYWFCSVMTAVARRDLGKIEAYQRDKERIEAGGADE
jgi:hypothetical protein